eukprot:jgi/Tetstr1/449376/TSEL_003886.t1
MQMKKTPSPSPSSSCFKPACTPTQSTLLLGLTSPLAQLTARERNFVGDGAHGYRSGQRELLLPYVPLSNLDFTPYLARARNNAEDIEKAFRFHVVGVGVGAMVAVSAGAKVSVSDDGAGRLSLDQPTL